jgi:hypothetical protein
MSENILKIEVMDLIKKLIVSLKKSGVELREIKVNDIEKMCFLEKSKSSVGSIIFGKDDGFEKDLVISEYPFDNHYHHDADMSKEYFFSWRPAIREIANYFENPVGVEVGVFEGFLSRLVIKYLNPKKYYLIDPWKEYNDKLGNIDFHQLVWDNKYQAVLKKFHGNPNVEVIRKKSLEAVELFEDESLDFVYIDADHDIREVFKDVSSWWNKVKSGGIISGHDFDSKDVCSAVYNFIYQKSINEKENPLQVYSEYHDWWIKKE